MFVDFVIHQFLDDCFVVVDNLPQSHVYPHLTEEVSVTAYLLDQLQLADHVLVILANGDILDVD